MERGNLMEIFALENLWEFAKFGLLANIVMTILTLFAIMLKLKMMNAEETGFFIGFATIRRNYILENTSSTKRIANNMLFFVPTYAAIMNIISIVLMFAYPGVAGMIKSSIVSDRLSLIPLIDYDKLEIE